MPLADKHAAIQNLATARDKPYTITAKKKKVLKRKHTLLVYISTKIQFCLSKDY